MRSFVALILFIVSSFFVSAQDISVPQVPHKMQFADLHLKITEAARKEIQSDVDALTASSKFFQAKVERAAMYMPFVEQVFKEEGLPDDFKYLAIQESGFVSDAVSSSNAVGFWQFKKLSAQEVGLRVDKKVDERKNIVASSRAAAKYLQKNNFYFNNWLYALQAYQMGAGGAMDALGDIKGGQKNMTIDKKTYWYIKKYLAHKIAFEEAVEKARRVKPKLAVYSQGAGKSLKEIASEVKIDANEIKEFNKWLMTDKVPNDKIYAVIIPTTEASMVLAAASPNKTTYQKNNRSESNLPPARDIVLSEDAYRHITLNGLPGVIVNEEMTIDELAELLDVDPNKLITYNDLLPHYRIIVGQVYYTKPKRKKARIFYHTVQDGETVWMIAQNYGMKQKQLVNFNRLENEDVKLAPGRILWLRKKRSTDTPVEYWPSSNSGEK